MSLAVDHGNFGNIDRDQIFESLMRVKNLHSLRKIKIKQNFSLVVSQSFK